MLTMSQLYHKMGKWEGILHSRELCHCRTLLLIQQGRSSLALVSQRSCNLSRNQIAATPNVCYNWQEIDNFQIKQWLKLPFCTVPCSVTPIWHWMEALAQPEWGELLRKNSQFVCTWDTDRAAPCNSALGWWKELPSPPGWILPALLKPQHCSHLKSEVSCAAFPGKFLKENFWEYLL